MQQFAQTVGVVDVGERWKRGPNDLFSRPHNLLQGLSFCRLGDGAAEDALQSPPVDGCQDGGGLMGFPERCSFQTTG